MREDLFFRLRSEIEKIPIVDTHEHFMLEKERLSSKLDFSYLFPHYACSDLVSSGMPAKTLEEIRCPNYPLEEKWRKFSPYWENIKNTAYSKSLLIAVNDIFGVEDLNERTWKHLSEKIAASNKPGWYEHVLKKMANIDVSLLDYLGSGLLQREASRPERMLHRVIPAINREIPQLDKNLFVPVSKFDEFVAIRSLNEIRNLEEQYNSSIHSLNDFLQVLDYSFEKKVKKEKIVAVKVILAYVRTLRFDKISQYEAEKLFNKIFQDLGEGLSWKEAKPLQDFIVHQLIQKAIAYQLPIQIHTGLQEGNGNIITNSDPTQLVNLFIEYNQAVFDIFHGGYPYTSEVATLAKNFPNVYADMCWLYIVSPYVARRTLDEWLEMIPVNKILGFGGDYIIVEGAYAHSRMARDNITMTLTKKIKEKYFSEEEALKVAKKILRENSYKIFKIKEKRN